MKCLILVMAFCICFRAEAAFEKSARGSAETSLGGASAALAENPWSGLSNPATLLTLTHRTVSASLVPRMFGLKELEHVAFIYVEPTSIGLFALSGSRFGFALYREIVVGVSYSARVSEKLVVGVTSNCFSLSIERYGSDRTIGIDAGAVVELALDLRWGFAAHNLNRPVAGRLSEKLPQVLITGVEYRPVERMLIAADMVKDIRYPVELHLGVQYEVLDALHLRSGTSLEPSLVTGGFGLLYPPIELDYAFSLHAVLGITHQMSVTISLEDFLP